MAVMEQERPGHPVPQALTAMGAALDGVAEVPCWSLPDDQVEEALAEACRLDSRLSELTTRLVGEVERRQLAKRAGGASTRAWLRHQLRLTPTDAKQRTALATALAGRLETTRQALAAGDLSRAHAQVIVKVMDTLPATLGEPMREKAERQLIGWCRDFDPGEVARLGRRLWEVIDPDGADERERRLLDKQEREARRQRQLAYGSDGAGGMWLRGRFDPEAAAVITTALDGLAKPLPSTADGPTPARRRNDTPTRSPSCAAASWNPGSCPPGAERSRSCCSP